MKTAEAKEDASRQKLIIIFSVIGSLLTAVGLILIFVNYWDKFPVILKSAFAFLPMLAGQGAAVYTFFKKRDSVPLKEGASVLWCTGVTATIALMDSIHLFMTDFSDCLFIDILLTLPVIFILDAVTPLLFVHFGINYLFIESVFRAQSFVITTAVFLALFSAATSYVFINRKQKDDIRHIFSQWISMISFSVLVITDILALGVEDPASWLLITTYFGAVYFFTYGSSFRLPFAPTGLIGLLAMSVSGVIFFHPEMMSAPYFGYEISEKIKMIICAVLCIILMITAGIIKRKVISKNKIGIALFVSGTLLILSEALCCIIAPEDNLVLIYLLTIISAFALNFSVIADGVMNSNLLIMNLGLVATAVNLVYMLYGIIEMDILIAGIILLIFGIALSVINILLTKKIRKSKEDNGNA